MFLLGISVFSFGQESPKTAFAKSKAEMTQSKTSGNYSFTLPKGTTSTTVEQNAKYYTHYFTVNYTESSQEAKITMITNDEKSRHIICRFLIASGVEKVNVEGKSMSVEEFYEANLK